MACVVTVRFPPTKDLGEPPGKILSLVAGTRKGCERNAASEPPPHLVEKQQSFFNPTIREAAIEQEYLRTARRASIYSIATR